MAQAKKRGVKLGADIPAVRTALKNAKKKSKGTLSEKANAFAESLRHVVIPLLEAGWSQRKVVSHLNRGKVKTARGGEWSLVQLQRVLVRIKNH